MKRILFVDDESKILSGLQKVLWDRRAQWDLAFMQSPVEALSSNQARPYDVVVADMRMPEMDGATFLQAIKEVSPATVRILHSGYANERDLLRSLSSVHQFIAKPCAPADMRRSLENACGLHDLLANPVLRAILGGIDKLPSLPDTYWRLVRLLERDDYEATEPAHIIEGDSSMCTKLLQLANSSYFGAAQPVTSVERALAFLGTDLFRLMVQSAYIFAQLPERPLSKRFSFVHMQRHALLVAKIARCMLPDLDDGREAFTAGLLHNIGYIIIATWMSESYDQIVEEAEASKRPMHVVEREILGATHADVGAYLLILWALPQSIIEAVLGQLRPWSTQPIALPLHVHEAVRIAVDVADAHVFRNGEISPNLLAAAAAAGISEKVSACSALAQREVSKLRAMEAS